MSREIYLAKAQDSSHYLGSAAGYPKSTVSHLSLLESPPDRGTRPRLSVDILWKRRRPGSPFPDISNPYPVWISYQSGQHADGLVQSLKRGHILNGSYSHFPYISSQTLGRMNIAPTRIQGTRSQRRGWTTRQRNYVALINIDYRFSVPLNRVWQTTGGVSGWVRHRAMSSVEGAVVNWIRKILSSMWVRVLLFGNLLQPLNHFVGKG
jgi:hypothetical protein